MSRFKGLFLLLLAFGLVSTPQVHGQEVEEHPKVILGGVPFRVTVKGGTELSTFIEFRTATGRVLASGAVAADGARTFGDLVIESKEDLPLQVNADGVLHVVDAPFAPGWYSILPPLLAIVLALMFKEVVTALLAGIWLGALAVAGYNPV
ncbi:MAG: hypothetical protein ACR2QM_14845, partial [Longimicrobiales bacterium]